jgi:hypothetical protein
VTENTATLQCGPKILDNTFCVLAALETDSVFAWIHYTRAALSVAPYSLLLSFQRLITQSETHTHTHTHTQTQSNHTKKRTSSAACRNSQVGRRAYRDMIAKETGSNSASGEIRLADEP